MEAFQASPGPLSECALPNGGSPSEAFPYSPVAMTQSDFLRASWVMGNGFPQGRGQHAECERISSSGMDIILSGSESLSPHGNLGGIRGNAISAGVRKGPLKWRSQGMGNSPGKRPTLGVRACPLRLDGACFPALAPRKQG